MYVGSTINLLYPLHFKACWLATTNSIGESSYSFSFVPLSLWNFQFTNRRQRDHHSLDGCVRCVEVVKLVVWYIDVVCSLWEVITKMCEKGVVNVPKTQTMSQREKKTWRMNLFLGHQFVVGYIDVVCSLLEVITKMCEKGVANVPKTL